MLNDNIENLSEIFTHIIDHEYRYFSCILYFNSEGHSFETSSRNRMLDYS